MKFPASCHIVLSLSVSQTDWLTELTKLCNRLSVHVHRVIYPLSLRPQHQQRQGLLYRVIQRVQNNHGADKLREEQKQVPLIHLHPSGQTAIRLRSGAHSSKQILVPKLFPSCNIRQAKAISLDVQFQREMSPKFRRYFYSRRTVAVCLVFDTTTTWPFYFQSHGNQILVSNFVFINP